MASKLIVLLGAVLVFVVASESKSLGDNNSTSPIVRQIITKRTIYPAKTARTELKVSRSLNPEDMQTLNVRTKSGQVTQLIVKRRGARNNALGSSSSIQNSTEASPIEKSSSTTQEANNATERSVEISTRPFIASQPLFYPKRQQPAEGRKLYDENELDGDLNEKISYFNKYYVNYQKSDDETATVQAEYGNWSPVTRNAEENINANSDSDDDNQKDESESLESSENKSAYATSSSYTESRSIPKVLDPDTSSIVDSNDRNPVHIEVVSTKVKDDIKSRAVPKPVFIRSDEMYIKGKPENVDFRRQKSVITIGKDGIPEVHGVRMPDDESDTKVWRNARVINGELIPYPIGYKPKPAYPEAEVPDDDSSESFGPFVKEDNFQDASDNQGYGPFTADDNMRDDQIDSVGPFLTSDNPTYNQKNLVSADFLRKGYGPFTKTDNSRNANTKLIEYIKQINDHEAKRDYFGRNSRSEKESNQVRFPQSENQLQRRMLQHPGNQNFPTSQLYEYTPKAEALVAPFNDGVRNPVLQYAHPELGVQPAKTPAANSESLKGRSKPQKVIYYTEDSNNNKSPYTMEPVMTTENYELNEDHLRRDSKYKPNKYYDNTEYSYNRYNYYRPELSKHHYGYIRRVQERPLWQRITDSMKETFQTGVETVQQFTKPILEPIAKVTKPVLEPLMEATQKISHNLGFTNNNPKAYYGDGYAVAEDKIGTVAGTGSVILPALGLMAGGAALGLGAVAVGRYLDLDLMRSSGWTDDMINNYIEMEHKRAAQLNWMRAMQQYDQDKDYLSSQQVYSDNVKMPSENVFVVMEAPKDAQQQRRLKRSLDANNFDDSMNELKRVKRKEIYGSDMEDDELQTFDNIRNDKFDQYSEIVDVYNAPSDSDHQILSNVQKIIDYTDSFERENQNGEHSIKKRSIFSNNGLRDEDDTMEMFIQSLESYKTGQGLASEVIAHIHRTDWSKTPCAKKTFCEVMSAQPADELFQMEKKMDSFLRVVHPTVASSVSSHLSDVMAAIRRNDCSEFKCQQT